MAPVTRKNEDPMKPPQSPPPTNRNLPAPFLALALSLAALNAGCISTERTVYQEPERVKIEFENDAAGRLFYEALSKVQGHHDRNESRTTISIPVIFEHKHRVIDGENVSFNQAVHRCDTNGDGRITEQEARIFAEQADKQP